MRWRARTAAGAAAGLVLPAVGLLVGCGAAADEPWVMDVPAPVTTTVPEDLFECPEVVPVSIPPAFEVFTLPRGAVAIEPPSILPGEDRLDLHVADRGVKDVLDAFSESLVEDGHDVLNTDYEGFEAEIYFLMKGGDSPGILTILIGCGDDVGSVVSIRIAGDG